MNAGPYTLQAAIAACHVVAFRVEDTDWPRVVTLYGELAEVAPSPIVELNRAVAVSMAFGPEAGLDLVDQLSRRAPSTATTCCTACAAICWRSSADTPRPKRPSSGPRRCRATSARRHCRRLAPKPSAAASDRR